MRMTRAAWPVLILGLCSGFLTDCAKEPTSAEKEATIGLRFRYSSQGAPRLGRLPACPRQQATPLAKPAQSAEVEMVRVMVLDFSAYDSSMQYFESEDYRHYTHARDTWAGDLKYWGEWRKLLGDFFRIVADQALNISGDVAKGTVTGVMGLNYLCVAGIEADTIRFWGEGEVMVREGEHAHAHIQVWDMGPVLYFLEMHPHYVALKNGLTQRFRCTAYYSNGQIVDVTRLAQWTLRPGLAGTLDQTGLFTASLQVTGEETALAFFAGDSAEAQLTVSPAALVLAEDFETYVVGAYPSGAGWEMVRAGVGGAVSRLFAFSGAQSFRQESSPGYPRRDLLPVAGGDSLTLQMSVLLQEIGGGAIVGLFDRKAPGGGAFVTWIEFAPDGKIYAAREGDRLELQAYQPSTWYTVRVELVYPYANVYVDGEQKAFMAYPSTLVWDALVLAAQDFASGKAIHYFDDVRVTRP